jgi:hypothetical protein
MMNKLRTQNARMLTVVKTIVERVDDPEVMLAAYESLSKELQACINLAQQIVSDATKTKEPEPDRKTYKEKHDPLPEPDDDGWPF